MLRQKARLFLKKERMTQKKRSLSLAFAWGKVDSNHRTDTRTDLQSVAIATMRLPQDLKERYFVICGCKSTSFFLIFTKISEIFRNFAPPKLQK